MTKRKAAVQKIVSVIQNTEQLPSSIDKYSITITKIQLTNMFFPWETSLYRPGFPEIDKIVFNIMFFIFY